ncbi:chromosome transmission fidelity protein 18 homolog [Ostrinia furnacalis]|uniref:chromosome transmission fidelity protein 18 homolog n=1 Tax=Ostrinia furnacalis TaxID=93504 RepID=UPI001040C115|nr:chromosome transmission fidelity protein 18 homolog [Ostrinia furnacalis]
MSDYPDPDEEYELMYADDLELLKEHDDHIEPNVVKKKPVPAKRSLDFSSPGPKNASAEPVNKDTTNSDAISNRNATPSVSNTQISFSQSLQPMEELLTPVNSNKRTAEDLFGDIGDIDFDNVEMPTKKQKTEEENDLELIDKILESRRLRQLLLEPSRAQAEDKPVFNTKENLSLDIPRWPFMALTNSDGDRIYVRLESETSWDQSLDSTEDQLSLQSMYAKTWDEARKILEKKQEAEILRQSQEPLPDISTDINGNNLWVDKYRPHSYIDLLSEEPVNRALLHWLHLWDKIVFKKEVKTTEPQQRNSFSKRTGQFQLSNKWKGKKEAGPEMDEDGRPHHKVALLCGPPGVGKTTLAHLLARLAGYRPVELNASDERSTDAFRNALQSATLMRSVIDAEKRPNCLILDEIDGAPLPTVELLVKWCTAAASEGKKKAKVQPLKRPVIAICNDLYATSLRPLRQVALIIQVGGVSLQRISSRLARVCSREGLSAPPHVLAALAARVHGDVRAAIHALSFIKARADQVSMEDVENTSVGYKDCSKSMMQALSAVFTTNDKDPNAIAKTVQAAGEYDRLVDGIFENYLQARVDARLLLACETLSWLRLYDAVHSWTLRHQNYSLYGLLPQCIVRCHRILASRNPQRVKFPMQAQEAHRKKTELDSIVWSVWRYSAPNVALTRRALQLDVIPLLPYLLAPTANIQLYRETERKALRTCASAMCDYALQYVQQRTPEGLYAFTLEPDVNKVALFGNHERLRPPPAVRQAIAREQQLEMIKRSEEMAQRVSNTNKEVTKRKSTESKEGTSKDGATSKEVKESRLPNHLQRLKPKEIEKTTPQVHKDFFGRIVPLSQIQRSDAVPDVISSSRVFYQYREGFNNAVRRNVRTRDLL